ncbi:MAG TPA: FtsX-like permease family protein, partial [Gammaproteobacteria bacterium]|nr:FtsX-like permease family protein [Gammaproteobacteria bacterium]
GNTVTLVAPRWNAESGMEMPQYFPLKALGTFSVGMHDFDAGFALLPLADAARVFGLGNAVSGIRIRFSDPDAAPSGASAIAARVGAGAASVNWTQYHRNFFYALKSQKRIMFVILSLIVAVAAFNIVASMVMVVKDKDRDIAILRTLGLGRRSIMLIFVIQGLLIGIAGVALGVVAGAWGATKADRAVAFVEAWIDIKFIKPDVYYIDYLPADVRFGDIAVISTVALTICLVATLYPAWRAAHTAPAVTLRYE